MKAPTVFVRDSGLLHALLGIADRRGLELHPKVGASWEGFAVEEVLKALRPDEAYFWATHQGPSWTCCSSSAAAASASSASAWTPRA